MEWGEKFDNILLSILFFKSKCGEDQEKAESEAESVNK
jgi:hypothetical protein